MILSELKDRVLERADMLGTQFIGQIELTAIINGEAAELHDLIVGRFEDQYTTSFDFVLAGTGGIALNSLPLQAPFYKLRGVDYDVGSGEYLPLSKYEWADRGRKNNGRDPRFARHLQYRLVGGQLNITPLEQSDGNYRMWYIPGYVDLVGPNDDANFPQNWVEYVIAGSAAKCLAKEESDVSVQLAIKASLRARIEAMAGNRDAGAPEVIERTRDRREWDDEW
jgi:hypothetical protein